MSNKFKLHEEIEARITQGYWTVMAIAGTEVEPGFSYTVGLNALGHPELIVMGLPPEVAHAILNDLAGRLVEGHSVTLDTRMSDVFRGYDALLLKVHPENVSRYMPWAKHHSRLEVVAWQLIYPDTNNKFNWHPEYEQRFKVIQPLLGDPNTISQMH